MFKSNNKTVNTDIFMRYIAFTILALLNTLAFASMEGSEKLAEPANDDDGKGKITGIVVDNKSEIPMEFANIAIYSLTDSALITGGITNAKGEFELNDVTYGAYFLEANFIGFQKSTVSTITLDRQNRNLNVGEITLSPSTVALGEIDVVADKAAVEYKLDKKVLT